MFRHSDRRSLMLKSPIKLLGVVLKLHVHVHVAEGNVSKATHKAQLQVLSVKWYHNEEAGSQIGRPLELRDDVKRNRS